MRVQLASGLSNDDRFWEPQVPRLGQEDNVFDDRNPVCSCVGMEYYTA